MSEPAYLAAEDADRLVAYLRSGSYVDVACRAVGISRETFDAWMGSDDPAHVELRDRVDRARAEAEVANLAVVSRAAREGVWAAAAWLLERAYPDRWARPAVRQEEKSEPATAGQDGLDELTERRSSRRARFRG